MSTTAGPYRLRPGTWADIPRAATIYAASFGNDLLMDLIYPDRQRYPDEWHEGIVRMLQWRYWTLGWRFTVAVDGNDEPLAFSWWNRGKAFESFWTRWLSPTWWFAPIVRLYLGIRNSLLLPLRSRTNLKVTHLIYEKSEKFMDSPRRRAAHYLSLVGVRPDLHRSGLGSLLIRDGLRDVDACGAAAWLCRLKGLRGYYERFGFKEVGTVAVGELAEWEGGQVMFRE